MGIACVTAAIEYAWTKKARHREHRVGSSDQYNLDVGLCENVLIDKKEQIGFVCHTPSMFSKDQNFFRYLMEKSSLSMSMSGKDLYKYSKRNGSLF